MGKKNVLDEYRFKCISPYMGLLQGPRRPYTKWAHLKNKGSISLRVYSKAAAAQKSDETHHCKIGKRLR